MAELTTAEAGIVYALADVWNAFMALPEEHPMDRQEFCQGVHRLQDKVLARAGRRALAAGVGGTDAA